MSSNDTSSKTDKKKIGSKIPRARETRAQAEALFLELKTRSRKIRRARKGYRNELYSGVARAASMLDLMDDDDALKESFVDKMICEKICKRSPSDDQLSLEIVAVLLGATDRRGRKKASKSAHVLRKLRKRGISPKRFPQVIARWGGIEKIYRKDAKRRKWKPSQTPSVVSGISRSSDDHVNKNNDNNKSRTNNHDICVGLYMKLADYDAMHGLPPGSGLQLEVLRIGQPNAELQVRRIILGFESE